jgi:DNA-binding SARP family transcriptional activator
VAHWRHGSGPPHALERKHAALLAWLWAEGPTPRSRLAGLLWPEASEERARGNLRQRLLKLRQEAGDLLDDENGVLRLKPQVVIEPPDPPGAALLQALEFDDCEAFARWLEGRREATRERRKREWLAEVREAAASQRLDDALYAADQLLQADRESEEAYRVLMEVSYLRGDHAAALGAWDRCRDMLRQLYGVRPTPATQQLGQTILHAAQQAAAAQAERAAWAPTPSAQPLLPLSVLRPPRLVGRQAALQALVDGWHAGHVLLVAGVAGVGKSRLLADWQATLGVPGAAAAR